MVVRILEAAGVGPAYFGGFFAKMDDLSIPRQEDTVEYRIYLPGASPAQVSKFGSIASQYLRHNFIKDYIWQDEPFELYLSSAKNRRLRPVDPTQPVANGHEENSLQSHWVGQTRFGDNLDDEWFIVFLLFELSKKFTEIFISIVDNDGQFLLIESALALPAWLDVDTSDNRVWIHRGQLHIIPPPPEWIERASLGASAPPLPKLALAQALERLRGAGGSNATVAPKAVFDCIKNRISGCAERASVENKQFMMLSLPTKVACVLKANPALVAPAVRGFYHRDPISLKDGVKMRYMGPAQPQVNVMVRFSRCLYAQLLRQEFHPPLHFGNKTKPVANNSKAQPMRDYDAWLLGAKLSVGMEIAYSEARTRRLQRCANAIINGVLEDADESSSSSNDIELFYDFQADSDWINYKAKITELGFFQSFKEDSAAYRSLEKKAKAKFLMAAEARMMASLPAAAKEHLSKDPDTGRLLFDVEIDNVLSSERLDVESFANEVLFEDSPTEWLNITPEEVDSILAARGETESNIFSQAANFTKPSSSSKKKNKSMNNVGKEEEDDDGGEEEGQIFDSMVKDMRKFMSGISSLEGVEQGGLAMGDEPLDPKKFIRLMKQAIGEELGPEDGSDDDEDGEGGLKYNLEKDDFYTMGSDDDDDNDDDGDDQDAEDDGSKESLRNLMSQMDRELGAMGLRDEFERVPSSSSTKKAGRGSPPEEEKADAPIDMNLNLVKNFLESYGAQHGLAGPVSNILGELRGSGATKK